VIVAGGEPAGRHLGTPTVFALPGFEPTVPTRLASTERGELAMRRAANGELHVEIAADVAAVGAR
jgi:hypothetical protein